MIIDAHAQTSMGEREEEQDRPGPIRQVHSHYSDTIHSFREVTDEVSGALSDCSFGASTISASSRRASSVPLESSYESEDEEESAPSFPREKKAGLPPRSPFSSRTNKPPTSNSKIRSARKRSGRLLLAKNLVKDATNLVEIGQDEKALKAYQQAIQIAGSEIARINVKIRTSASHSNVAQRSIKDRLGQDLRKIAISVGKLRTKMAIVYERLGDYDNAILCCQEAKSLYASLPNHAEGSAKSIHLVEAIQNMIQQLQSTKEALSERTGILQELEAFRAEAERTKDPIRRAKCFVQMEKLASAVMALEVKILGACHPQVADSLQLLSTISLERSNAVSAIHYLDQAIAISQECLGNKHPRIGQYCLRLARICQSSGAETKALENFEKAIRILSHSTKYSRMLGSTLNDIAVIHMRRGQTSTALEKLHLALKHYNMKCDPMKASTEGVADDIIQVHQNMASCYMAEGNFGRAKEIYTKVLDLQTQSRKVYEDVKDLGFGAVGVEESLKSLVDESSIAQTLVNLGRAFAAEGDHEEAINSLKKAHDMFNTLVAEDGMRGGGNRRNYLEYKRRITKVLFCIAEENIAIGNLDEAMKHYTESIGIFCLLGEDCQGANADHVAHCNLGMSKIFCQRNDIVGAHRLLKKTMRNCLNGKIKASDKTIQVVQARLNEVEANLKRPTDECLHGVEENARMHIKTHAYDAALLNLRAALSVRKKKLNALKAMKLDVSEEIHEISNLLEMFGLVYARQGDMENSGRAYAEAYRLRSKTNE